MLLSLQKGLESNDNFNFKNGSFDGKYEKKKKKTTIPINSQNIIAHIYMTILIFEKLDYVHRNIFVEGGLWNLFNS